MQIISKYIIDGKGSWKKEGVAVKSLKQPVMNEDVEMLKLRIDFLERQLADKERIITLLDRLNKK